jgi:glycosyltransferase involved in cell wall biosynthesis
MILHVISGLGSGGAERTLTRLVTAAKRNGHRQAVVCLSDGGFYANALRQGGVDLYCLGLVNAWHFPLGLYRLARLVRELRPNLMITWLYHADFLGTLAAIGSGLGPRRVVWSVRCSNIDFSNYRPRTRLIATMLAWMSRLPWAVMTNSRAGRRAHEKLGYRPRQWIYLPNGLDTTEWSACSSTRSSVRSELGFSEENTVVGMIARVDPQKDHGTLLAAADILLKDHPQLRFLLIGKGTETIEAASFLCLGEQVDVSRLIKAFDIAVLCSAYGEGFPNVVVEAMATEIPCVVTDVGDAKLLVSDTGFVSPTKNPRALAEAIECLISESELKRKQRGRRARKSVLEKWSFERFLDHHIRLWGAHDDDFRVQSAAATKTVVRSALSE